MAVRYCADTEFCQSRIPENKRADAIYCSRKCAKRVGERRRREKKRTTDRTRRVDAKSTDPAPLSYTDSDESEDGRASVRRGRQYEDFLRDHPDLAEKLVQRKIRVSDVAEIVGTTSANVSRWQPALREDIHRAELRATWEMDAEDLAALDGGYEPFVRRFHPGTLIRDFDSEWESEIDRVVGSGGQLLLLAPQRHGKTEFLARYCQRRITQNPDIRILWVGRTQELAEEAVGFVRQLLEDEDYCDAVLGPGERFQPTKRGRSWTDKKFTVAQREAKHKSPTMRALGIGGTTSGRDADLIVIDDPQEREDIEGGATAGDKQRKWFFTTFLARKMPHTGIAYITSRKHPRDIPAAIMDDHADDWRVVTYQAHDIDCILPEDDTEAHVDCVLWPERRPFSALMKQKRADELWFECNYQNNPTTSKLTLVTKEQIAEAVDPRVLAGYFPPGWNLVAGFDPASGKENAAVLWAYSAHDRRAQVVTAKRFRAGPAGLADAMDEWFDRFHCVYWVTETNWAGGFLGDPRVTAFKDKHGVRITPHQTKHNKIDYSGGVTSMIQMIHHERLPIRFPTLTNSEDSEGVKALMGELLAYDSDASKRKHFGDDLVMAMWFPWWQKLQDIVKDRSHSTEMQVEYASVGNPLGGF